MHPATTRGPSGPLVTWLALGALGVAVALLAARRLDVVEVRGRSMAPTLLPGDRLLAVRLRGVPRAGQVVLAPDPRHGARELVKRVHAVGPGGVEVRGDNPAFSTDARTFGLLPARSVGWRVLARVGPLGRVGLIRNRTPLVPFDEGGEPACPIPDALLAGD